MKQFGTPEDMSVSVQMRRRVVWHQKVSPEVKKAETNTKQPLGLGIEKIMPSCLPARETSTLFFENDIALIKIDMINEHFSFGLHCIRR